jgi:tetratricopeptide (TPR) repeat protein
LLHNHLLQQSEQEGDEPRFSLFETIREYGLECLIACGEVEQARNAHAAYYQAYVEKARAASRGAYHVHAGQWRNRLYQDYDNIRAALQWLQKRNEHEAVLRLTTTLGVFWLQNTHAREERTFLEQALAAIGENNVSISLSVKAEATYIAGRFAFWSREAEQAIGFLEQSAELFRTLQDRHQLATTLSTLSVLEQCQNNFTRADALYDEALSLARKSGEKKIIATVLMSQGMLLPFRGELAHAAALCEESLQLARETGDVWTTAVSLHYLGWIAHTQGSILLPINARRRVLLCLESWAIHTAPQKPSMCWPPRPQL